MTPEIEEVLNYLTINAHDADYVEAHFTELTFTPGKTCYIPDGANEWHLAVITEVSSNKVIASFDENSLG